MAYSAPGALLRALCLWPFRPEIPEEEAPNGRAWKPPTGLVGSSRSLPCCRVCHRLATGLALETRKPGLTDRVPVSHSWLSEAERGGFEPPVPLARHNGFRDRRIKPALPPLHGHASSDTNASSEYSDGLEEGQSGDGQKAGHSDRTLMVGCPADPSCPERID